MRTITLIMLAVLASLVLAACGPAATPQAVVQTVVVTKMVEVVVSPRVQEVVKEVVVTATPSPENRELELFHWWTASGEQEAANAMFKVLKDKHPEVEVIENPVAGGGGASHRVILQARLSANIPPDTFQTTGGAELKSYVDGNYLMPLDDLYTELNYKQAIPKPLADAVTIGGHPYVVPLNMHIQNILYYSQTLLSELGLEAPKTFDELVSVAKAIKQAKPDMYPLALGSKEKWEAAFILDSILLELGGPEYYVKLYKGEINVIADPTFRLALEKLQSLRGYIYTDHSDLTWDQSCDLVVKGDSAMVLMGTWAIGYFKSKDWLPGQDFNAITFPQSPERILLFHSDAYGITNGAPHPQTTMDWLKVVASPELQISTDVIQGGLFARIDIDAKKFPDPIRQELQTYISQNPDKLILDQHGSIAPFTFTQAYWEIVAAFISAPDISVTINNVSDLLGAYDVRKNAAWYQWP